MNLSFEEQLQIAMDLSALSVTQPSHHASRPQSQPDSSRPRRIPIPYRASHHDLKVHCGGKIPPTCPVPRYSEMAQCVMIVHRGGVNGVGFDVYMRNPTAIIGTVVAGNSGHPAGSCGGKNGRVNDGSIHPDHTTQEEDAVANWLSATCESAGKPIRKGVDNPLAHKLYRKVIASVWGMCVVDSTCRDTIQGIDYIRAGGSAYADAWVVLDAKCCNKYNGRDFRCFRTNERYNTHLVFVAGPNVGAEGRNERSACRRTFNRYALRQYPVFREGVWSALYAALVAMARTECTIAILPQVSGGIYAGPHKRRIREEYCDIVREVLNEPVSTPGGGLVQLGRFFEQVIIAVLAE